MKLRSLSASSADVYEGCPARWRAQYTGDRVQELASEAADIGTACHEALEYGVKQYASTGVLTLVNLIAYFDTAYWKLFTDRARYDEGVQMMKTWHARMDFTGRTVLSTEVKSHFLLPTSAGDLRVNYIWDRCDRIELEDGGYEIVVVDYKGLALDTVLPTPVGWTSIRDVAVGDSIISGDGNPCLVTAKSDVHENPCYRIQFDDGAAIVADHEHLWSVTSDDGPQLMTTEELKDQLFSTAPRPQRHLRIETTSMNLPEANLPIDPYVLGAWLGDGTARTGQITKPCDALFTEIERRGYVVGKKSADHDGQTRNIVGLNTKLRELGLRQNKHIPLAYMRSSRLQRLDLLRGLMDTDGHWNPLRKRCVLVTVDKAFAQQVDELICSLGWTAHTFEVDVKGYGLEKRGFQVWFTPFDAEVFLARRPADYRFEGTTQSRRRLIKSVDRIPTVPTQCIQVDSPDHTFLCGHEGIRTHNTVSQPVQPQDLKNRIQPRLYALAAQLQFKDCTRIRVMYDLLRYDEVGIVFTRDDNVQTWKYLRALAERILADNTARERLNPDCRWCIRRDVCQSLRKHVAIGGPLSLNDPAAAVDLRRELADMKGGIEKVLDDIDEFILDWAKQNEVLTLDTDQTTMEIGVSSRRNVDAERAAQVIGPELVAQNGSLTMAAVDKMLKGSELTAEQKRDLRALIGVSYGSASVKTKQKPAHERIVS